MIYVLFLLGILLVRSHCYCTLSIILMMMMHGTLLIILCTLTHLILGKGESWILILHVLLLKVVQFDHGELFLQRRSSLLLNKGGSLSLISSAAAAISMVVNSLLAFSI